MIPNIGPLEIAIVLAVCLLVFGPRKLPQLGRSAGETISEFRRTITGGGDADKGEREEEPAPASRPAPEA